MTKKYDSKPIQEFIERVRLKVGDDDFTTLRLIQLEKVIRTYDKERSLPGKTRLREEIHSFRKARWPALMAPKPSVSRFRY